MRANMVKGLCLVLILALLPLAAFGAEDMVKLSEDGLTALGVTDTFTGPELAIPEGVTAIAAGAFAGETRIESVVFPSTLTAIGDGAFKGCGLVTVSVPKSVTSLGSDIFRDCENLVTAEVATAALKGGAGLFRGCHKLETAAILSGMREVPADCFLGCESLTAVSLPGSVIKLGSRAFMNCQSLETLDLPDNMSTISALSFAGCTSLSALFIPNTVSTLAFNAFQDDDEIVVYCRKNSCADRVCARSEVETENVDGEVAVRSIQLIGEARMTAGDSQTLTWELNDSRATSALTLSSSDEDVLTVNQKGKIKTNKKLAQAATVTLTAVATDGTGTTAQMEILVTPRAQSVAILLDGEEVTRKTLTYSIAQTTSISLSASVSPADAYQAITFTSSDKAVATVDENGTVTFLKRGNVTISARTEDGTKIKVSVKLSIKK